MARSVAGGPGNPGTTTRERVAGTVQQHVAPPAHVAIPAPDPARVAALSVRWAHRAWYVDRGPCTRARRTPRLTGRLGAEAGLPAAAAVPIPASLAVRYICLLPFEDARAEALGYDTYLHDAENAYQYASDAARLLAPLVPLVAATEHKPEELDLFLPVLLRQLRRFLSAPAERNLMLTGIVSALALYPDVRLFNHIFNSDLFVAGTDGDGSGQADAEEDDPTTVYGVLQGLRRAITGVAPTRDQVASPRTKPFDRPGVRCGSAPPPPDRGRGHS
jgi:hypothetical protein